MQTFLSMVRQAAFALASAHCVLVPALANEPIADLNPGAGGSRGEAFTLGVRLQVDGVTLPSPQAAVYFCAGAQSGNQVQARVLARDPSAGGALTIETLRTAGVIGGPPILPVFFSSCHRWIEGPDGLWFLFANRIAEGVEALEIWTTAGDSHSFRQIHRAASASFGGVAAGVGLSQSRLYFVDDLPRNLVSLGGSPPAYAFNTVVSIDDPTLTAAKIIATVPGASGDEVLFTAIRGPLTDRVLFRTRALDPHVAIEVLDMSPGTPAGAGNAIGEAATCGGRLYFAGLAPAPDNIVQLWTSGQSGQQPEPILASTGEALRFPADLREIAGDLFLSAEVTGSGREPVRLRCQTPPAPASVLGDLMPGSGGSEPGDYLSLGPLATPRVVFAASGPAGRELYGVSPTLGGGQTAFLVHDFAPAEPDEVVVGTRLSNNDLVVIASDSAVGRRLFRISNSIEFPLVEPLLDASTTGQFDDGTLPLRASFDGFLVFYRTTPAFGRELHAVDETPRFSVVFFDGFE